MIVVGHLLNLNLSAFGREERGLETLRGLPLEPRHLLLAKFHVSFVLSLPVVALGLGLVGLAVRGEATPTGFWGEAVAVVSSFVAMLMLMRLNLSLTQAMAGVATSKE